jgi:hypothetical protein
MIQEIVDSPYFVLMSFIIGLFGLFIGIYYYFKSKKERKPVYQLKGFNLISDSITSLEKIEIFYNKEMINNLNFTKFSFWNSGQETIRKEDFVKADPFRVQIDNKFKIYGANIEKADDKNDVKVSIIKGKYIDLEFDYLDINQGFILNIYSNAKNISVFSIEGSFKGSSKIKKGYVKQKSTKLLSEKIFDPLDDYLRSSKYKVIKVFGTLLSLPLIFILLPVFIPFMIYDVINDTFSKNLPKEFDLEKN